MPTKFPKSVPGAHRDEQSSNRTTDADRIHRYFESASWSSSAARKLLVDERRGLLFEAAEKLGIPFEIMSVCDVGCGDGGDLRAWREVGVPEERLAGTELVPSRAAAARRALPGADIRIVAEFNLPFDDLAFDICSASLVLSAVRQATDRRRLLGEMSRVTRRGGLVIVYDLTIRKPWNRNIRRITTRHLSGLWRRPDSIDKAAPLLPVFEAVTHLPMSIRHHVIHLLPRTHRLWIWNQS